jgi:catechol 2,3-dioxygenase-like lactoylglutathione lyase family enzyme
MDDSVGNESPLGAVTMAATTLYVADLDASVAWYHDLLEVEPVERTEDEFPYARYRVGGLTLVLEPVHAATDPVDSDRAGGAAINLVVDRDPSDVRADLVGRGITCTEIRESPQFASFLVRDPDGHRLYITRPHTT